MDRYSVMFETFLTKSAEPRSSLLERRQSRLKRVKGLDNLNEVSDLDRQLLTPHSAAFPRKNPHSPHAVRTPALAILVSERRAESTSPVPSTSSTGTALNRPRPIRRSNTAPPGAISPVGAGFAKERRRFLPPATNDSPRTPRTPLSAARFSEPSLPPTPDTSTTACTELADDEPEWEMLTAARKRHSPEWFRHSVDRRAAQVAVARSVSVSVSQASGHGLVESRQPLRPRVVELGKNRKSTVAVVECDEA